MGFSDFFTNGDNNPFPADHGAATEGDGDGHLHPDGNKVGDGINGSAKLSGRCFRLLGIELMIAGELFGGGGDQVEVGAELAAIPRCYFAEGINAGNKVFTLLRQGLDR